MYENIKIYKIIVGLVLVFSITNSIKELINFDIIGYLSKLIGISEISSIVSAIILGLCGYLLLNRNFYLPFLGHAVYPCASLIERTPENANNIIKIKVSPNTNVIYWGSENKSNDDSLVINNPWDAYGNYDNYGVVKSDSEGIAVLKYRTTVKYKIPSGKKLDRHLHYRYCIGNGMMSEVKTVNL